MGDVEVFYGELTAATSSLDSATSNLVTTAADLHGDDTGVDDPAHRTALRLEMHRRLAALHDRAYDKIEAGSDVSSTIQQIANSYSDLDVELTGQDQP